MHMDFLLLTEANYCCIVFKEFMPMRYLLLLFLLFSTSASANCGTNCKTTPSCAELGYSQSIVCPEGYVTCPFDKSYKWCKEYKCEDGRYESTVQNANTGYVCDAVKYHGLDCYDCYCAADDSVCQWTISNAGEARLDDLCCNNKYKRCVSNCADLISLPDHAVAITQGCSACGQTRAIVVDFKCMDNYALYAGQCLAAPCADGYSTAYSDVDTCGLQGSAGWNYETSGYSGEDICGKCTAKSCPDGESTANDACGNGSGWTRPTSGNYSGEELCYNLSCTCGKSCTWSDANKGTASIANLCCDGKYETCTSSCIEITAPANAHISATCNGCNVTVNSAWECNEGYVKNADGTGCTAAGCTDGFDTKYQSVNDCGSSGSDGWSYTTGGMSGDKACGKCTAKTCSSGSTESDITKCGSGKYWFKDFNNSYAGDAKCYNDCVCRADAGCTWSDANKGTAALTNLCCNGKYESCSSSCVEVTVPANAQATSTCTGCGKTVNTAWACKTGYTQSGNACIIATCNAGCATAVSECGSAGDKGWTLGANCNMSGTSQCKTCTPKACPSGSDTNNAVSSCGYSSTRYASKPANGSFNGDTSCYACKCEAPAACKWDNSNKGTATITNQCCNGKYETCTSTCVEVTVPANAHATATCTGCSATVNTAWECNEGYTQNGNTCRISTCPANSAIAAADCGSSGTKGWKLSSKSTGTSGASTCYLCEALNCTSGDTTSAVSSCGYPAVKYASKPANGSFNGDSACYDCKCEAPAACKWDDSNKGTANITNQCCNGKYETCRTSCAEVTVPANGHATTTCTGCGLTVNTAWECNSGYVKNAAGNACIVATCNAGCATSTSGCGSAGDKGWTLGSNCNISGGSQCKTCTKKSCPTGSDTNNAVSSCGYSSTRYASKPANDSFNGDAACYACKCEATAACKWDNSNKGNATITNQCCNGKYETCTDSCFDTISLPANANPVLTSCTGCGETSQIITGFTCHSGYNKNAAGTGCQEAGCPSGYSTAYQSVTDCGSAGSNGWTFASNGKSGAKVCGKCTAKSCPSGSSTSYSAAANCGSSGSKGWTSSGNGSYAGNAQCYTCTAKTCPSGTSTSYSNADNCGSSGTSGWTSTGTDSYAGNTQCYSCSAKTCTAGDTNSAVSSCGYPSVKYASKPANGYHDGNSACYACKCEAPSSCKWNNTNKGTANISSQCCNGNYESCSSTCVPVNVPANATATATCTGCGTTVNTAWTCNSGYTKSGNSCIVSTCPAGSATTVSGCGSSGSSGWTLGSANGSYSGPSPCKTCSAKYCPPHTSTSNDPSFCGYPSTRYATLNSTGSYNGDAVCYVCDCLPPAACKWTDDNKGTANITNLCCNGNYETCTSSCAAVTVPSNAHATATCTGCGTTVSTAWACNDGYIKSGNSCVVATCNTGCATSTSRCGSSGDKGWTLGANCNKSGVEQCKTCTKKACPTGSDTNSALSSCGYTSTKYASKLSNGSYNGDSMCYTCKCEAPASCKWDNSNKGDNATISNQCCNGKYETCVPYEGVVVPENGHVISTVTSCGQEIPEDWECNDGYTPDSTGTGCEIATCPSGTATTVEDCGSQGSKGWTLSSNIGGYTGSNACYKCLPRNCDGCFNSAQACSGLGAVGETVTTCAEGEQVVCVNLKCKCTPPSTCKYNSANAGDGILSGDACCDGSYTKCSAFARLGIKPTEGEYYCSKYACNGEICTAYECNSGYKKIKGAISVPNEVSMSPRCVPNCPDGYATEVAHCGATGSKGWMLGKMTNGTAQGKTCYQCLQNLCMGSADSCDSSFTNYCWNGDTAVCPLKPITKDCCAQYPNSSTVWNCTNKTTSAKTCSTTKLNSTTYTCFAQMCAADIPVCCTNSSNKYYNGTTCYSYNCVGCKSCGNSGDLCALNYDCSGCGGSACTSISSIDKCLCMKRNQFEIKT